MTTARILMKIKEIIDTEYSTNKMDQDFDRDELQKKKDHKQGRYDKGLDTKGYGTFAKVEIDPDEPFTAKKRNHLPIYKVEHDGYYAYIKAITDHKLMQSNPYFPRVYKVEIDTDSFGDNIPSYEMETLRPEDDFDDSTIFSLGDKMFIDFDDLAQRYNYYAGKYEGTGPKSRTGLRFGIGALLEEAADRNDYSKIKDTKLKQALELIHNVARSNKSFFCDIHRSNWMIRPTLHGPQLVLTDPIAN